MVDGSTHPINGIVRTTKSDVDKDRLVLEYMKLRDKNLASETLSFLDKLNMLGAQVDHDNLAFVEAQCRSQRTFLSRPMAMDLIIDCERDN